MRAGDEEAPGFLVLFLEGSKNRSPVFGSILGIISVMPQICDILFHVHDCVVIFWYPRQYVPTVDCVAGTCCASGLGFALGDSLRLWPQALPLGLASLVALGFALGTCFAHGLGLAETALTIWINIFPQYTLHS